MEYGKLIGGAYRIALHNWRLWPFGVFAGTGGFGFNFQFGSDLDGGGSGSGSFDPDTALIVAVALLVVVLALGFLVLSVLSQGALAQSVAAIARGQQRGFREALRSGRQTFWPMAGLYALAMVVGLGMVLLVAVLAGGPVLAVFAITDATGLRVAVIILAALMALAALACLFIPFVLLFQHAIREVALREARPVGALRAGWRVLRANPVPTLLLFLIQQGLVLAGFIGLGMIAGILFLPAIVLLVVTGVGVAGIAVAAVTGLLVLPAALAAAGAIGTFGHGLWTLGYLRMVDPPSSQEESHGHVRRTDGARRPGIAGG